METSKAIAKIKKTREYRDDEENKREIDSLEKSFSKALSRKEFLKQDYIQEIVAKIKSILGNIRINLVEEDDEIKRIQLKSDRDAYLKVLSFFTKDIDNELASIEEKVNSILET